MGILDLKKPSKEKTSADPRRVARGVESHVDQAAATELSRNALARERYEFLMRATFILGVLQIISAFAIVYLATRPAEVKIIRTDSEGRIAEIQALDNPIQSNQEVLQWTAKALTNAYTLSFANYPQQLNDLKAYFTSTGWTSFNDALSRAGFLENLNSGKFVTTAVPAQAPTVNAEGLVGGVYGWRVQMPLTITYKSVGVDTTQNVVVEVTVVRRSPTENPSGLGIAQIISH